jgi:RNA polymerase sigma-70 factor (ECF subfamily)
MHERPEEITQSLHGWQAGDRQALALLLPIVHRELRCVAHFHLRRERPDHTLQSTALVNEAYLRLVGMNSFPWEGRTHFFAIAAKLMRQILVDYARRLFPRTGVAINTHFFRREHSRIPSVTDIGGTN